jgi:phosphoglycolate phosphatase
MVRLVLFDIDGTLIRTGGAGIRAFARAFESEFKLADGFERLKFPGRTDIGLVREFLGFHQIVPTPENLQRFFECYVFWLDHLLRESQAEVCAGVWTFIQELRALAPPPLLGLLTGNIRLGAEIKLRHCDLWDVFETGAFGDEHEERNQIAAIAHQRGCRILGTNLHGDEVLVVGDTPHDIRCGRAIGARVLAVATGGARFEELQALQPDWLVRDLRAISTREVVE